MSTPNPEPYKVTAIWDEVSLPAAIRGEHSTKAGTWGLLRVLSGQVKLVFHDPLEEILVTADRPALIMPQAAHHVETIGPVRMQVEFYHQRPSPGA